VRALLWVGYDGSVVAGWAHLYEDIRNAFGKSGLMQGGQMRQVLITRPEPGAGQTAERIAALGLTPVVAPVLTIEPAARLVRLPDRFAATVLTSGNAVAGCPPACHARPAFAVGSATAAKARAAGFGALVDADADASVLPDLIARTVGADGQTLFLPTAVGQGSELAAALRGRGYRVLRRAVYRAAVAPTLPAAAVDALRAGSVKAALFFSGETARGFVRLVRAAGLETTLEGVEAVAISGRTEMALRPLPWRHIRVAERPNQDAMLVLLT
jgi:uroporphyrinogen-III synthase